MVHWGTVQGGSPPESLDVGISNYVLGGTALKRDRLLAQARELAPYTRIALDRIGPGPGARAADIGCGPTGITDVLSEVVGPGGAVVGVEREPRFAEMARGRNRTSRPGQCQDRGSRCAGHGPRSGRLRSRPRAAGADRPGSTRGTRGRTVETPSSQLGLLLAATPGMTHKKLPPCPRPRV